VADISKISLPNGTTYNIKDSNALTDDLFNMTPTWTTYDEEHDTYFLNSDVLSLVAHNRPILIDFGDGMHSEAHMYYYMHEAFLGTAYEGCKIYGTIARLAIVHPSGVVTEQTYIQLIAINPQNGNLNFVMTNFLSDD